MIEFPAHHDIVRVPCGSDLARLSSQRVRVRRMLVVGERPDTIDLGEGCERRRCAAPPGELPRGAFAFWRNGSDWDAIVFDDDPSVGAIESWALARLHEKPSWAGVPEWFEYLWPNALSDAPPARFKRGDYVRRRGDDRLAVVDEVVISQAGNHYRILVDGRPVLVGEDSLEPAIVSLDDPTVWLESPPVGAADLAATLTFTKLDRPLTDTLYSYRSSRTVYRPYQFRPVLRLLNSASQRLLIADEVGLGKTIEAGIVWTELDQRVGVNRALVVCPSNLVRKWQSELLRRFERRVEILDRQRLTELVEMFERGDTSPFAGVVSLERLRSDELLPRLADTHPRFDLIIVDEAHALRNQTTRSYALGDLLSDWADVLLFLSATPVNLRSDDLFNLLHLLADDEFPDKATFELQMEPVRHLNTVAAALRSSRHRPDSLLAYVEQAASTQLGKNLRSRPEFQEIERRLLDPRPLSDADIVEIGEGLSALSSLSGIFSRTRKADVPDAKAKRQAMPIDVHWTETEYRVYFTILEWVRERARRLRHPVGFATVTPLRQAASCLPAMRELLLQRHAELRDPSVDDDDDIDDPFGDREDEQYTDVASDEEEASLTERLRDALEELGTTDTKFDRFIEGLATVRALGLRQVMVFSFFRRTLRYLYSRLTEESGYRVRIMDGSVKMEDRARLMEQFREGQFDILLLSEVGSEGLDFEFCGALFNYDLPWNPMRVEQRIGRLDRIGQRHERIYIFNFHVPGTIETDIFQRLYDRIRVFEESIGELEPILQDEVSRLTKTVLSPALDDRERAEEVERISIALERKRREIEDIEAAESLLSGIDGMLVDGLEASIKNGRYLGAHELEQLVRRMMSGTSARLRNEGPGKPLLLKGDEELAARVTRYAAKASPGRPDPGPIARALRDGDPIFVTFDPDVAGRTSAEFVTARHPLVSAAVAMLAESREAMPRFGTIAVPSAEQHGRFLVLFGLLETTGVRPSVELVSSAVRLDDFSIIEGVGDLVLGALAEGTWRDGASADLASCRRALSIAFDHLVALRARVEAQRASQNESLVDQQQATKAASFDFKIRRAEQTLQKLRAEGRDQRVQRLHAGRISNLRQQREAALAELERRRGLAVSVQPVAVAVADVISA